MTASYKVLMLPGDGVGPEVLDEAGQTLRQIASARGFNVEFSHANVGGAAIDAHGVPVRDEDIELARSCDAVMLGAVGGPQWENVAPEIRPEAGLLKLRQALGLFANIRPIRVYDALVDASPLKPEVVRGVDLVIVRELTGGIYFGKPSERWESDEGRQAVDTLPYGEREIRRIAELAFKMAGPRHKKVTSVDKANVMATSRLWREITTEVASDFPDVTLDHALVDSCAMRLISRPLDFDVMVMENMFGDILSDEAAVLAGSLGMLPSASLSGGEGKTQFGVYEPIHGSAPDIAGQGLANPCGAILSMAMMLRTSFGLEDEAGAVEEAVNAVLSDGARTRDIAGGDAHIGTAEFGDLVRSALADSLGTS
ncbi:3-isopropylmalate dehydrogenase [soil metagenome]